MSLWRKKDLAAMLSDAEGGEKSLKRTLGAFQLVALGVGAIIGAGLYVDNEIGAATATGHGEEVIRIAGCHLVVELMRQGKSPQNACEEAVARVVKLMKLRKKELKDIQVGFIALNKNGEHGSYCVQSGFNYAVHDATGNVLLDAPYHFKL